MKRLIPILLTLSLLLSLAAVFTGGAAAETPTSQELAEKDAAMAEKYAVRLGESTADSAYYTSLWNAYNAAKDGDTLYMIKDITTGTFPLSLAAIKTLTIDGQGHRYISDKEDSWMINLNATEHLTVRNIQFEGWRAFYTADSANKGNQNELTIDGCTVTLKALSTATAGKDPGTNPANLLFDQYSTDITLNVLHSTVESQSGVGLIFFRQGGTHTVNIADSVLSMSGTALNMDSYYNSIIGGWGNKGVSVTVDETSTLRNANTSGGEKSQAFLISLGGAKVAVASGAKMELLPTGTFSAVRLSRTGDNTGFVDGGMTLTLSPDAQKLGTNTTGWLQATGNTMLGIVQGNTLSKGSVIQNEDAVENLTVRSAQLPAGGLKNTDGASIRKQDPYGIRFSASVSSELRSILTESGVSFRIGMVVAPTAFLGEDGLTAERIQTLAEDQYRIYGCEKFYAENVDGFDSYHLALTGFAESKEAFTTKLSATAFLTYVADGIEYTVYADYNGEVNARSIYEVAVSAKAAGETSELIDRIIATVEAEG